MIWHLRCNHLSKETFKNIIKRITKDEIEAFTTLQCLDCAQIKVIKVVFRRPFKDPNDIFERQLFFDLFILFYSYNN